MTQRPQTKFVHEGKYVAEVEIELIESDVSWSPCISLDDAYKLDDVRSALRRGDIKMASNLARVFTLVPIT